jgi:DNA mismatch endonuclease (patch repair protein)
VQAFSWWARKSLFPEITHSLVHRLGYRYALHRSYLPGHPDIVLVKYKKIIFVHGCFWHMHRCRYGRVIPATRTEFWQDKRCGNVERDKRNLKKLRNIGWKILVIWECQIKKTEKLTRRLRAFLE